MTAAQQLNIIRIANKNNRSGYNGCKILTPVEYGCVVLVEKDDDCSSATLGYVTAGVGTKGEKFPTSL